MKTAIQLVLIYFGFLQIFGTDVDGCPLYNLFAGHYRCGRQRFADADDHYSGTDDGNPVDGNLSLESRLYK